VPIFVPTRGTPPEPQSDWVHYVPDAATAMPEAKAAAGDQDVMVHGAGLAQSLLREGLLDELEIHLIPVVLGDGRRLFGADRIELEIDCPHWLVRSFVYEGKPEDEAIDTYPSSRWTREPWSGCARVHSSIAARDAHFESGGAPGLRASGRVRGIATERSIPREQAHPEDVDVARRLRGRRQRRQRIHLLLHVRGRCHRAEAVFIGGNGFRAARAVHHLECRTGRLVLEANQVLLWSVLEKAGAPVAVRGVRDVVRRPST
jgi:hypothetical protein